MESKGTKNELAALVAKVRNSEHTKGSEKPSDKAIEQIEKIDAPGQRLYELLQQPVFRVHRERLDEVKQDAQHVSTCRKRISDRLAELCERGGVDKATVDALHQAPLHDTLRGWLRKLLPPEDCDYVGLDLAVKLETGCKRCYFTKASTPMPCCGQPRAVVRTVAVPHATLSCDD